MLLNILPFAILWQCLSSITMIQGGVIHSSRPSYDAEPDENKRMECSYLVQLAPGKKAESDHFKFLNSKSNLMDGIQQRWHIGQTFQGYHMNLCNTIVATEQNEEEANASNQESIFVQQLQSQYKILESAPHILALEQDQQVTQTGWLHVEEKEEEKPLDDEHQKVDLFTDVSNEDNEEDENLLIAGQQAGTVACQNDASWSLYRVGRAKVDLPLKPSALTYPFSYVYAPVVRPIVYIMDTQVWTQHPQFAGRAQTVQSYVNDLNDTTVPFPPHGTHVAGIVGSARYGPQKWSEILSVVTLNRKGTGSFSNVLNGATWIAADAAKRASPLPAVVNLSLSGGKSSVVNAAMDALVDAGLIVVVAVGNSNIDSCTQSPASATKPVKVAASDSSDQFATFSNWGACVDIIAPGVVIQSTGPYNKQLAMSGSSMSSPLVAGIIASALANGDLSVAKARDNYQLKYFLNQKGISNVISKVHAGTVNLLAQTANAAAPGCPASLSGNNSKEEEEENNEQDRHEFVIQM